MALVVIVAMVLLGGLLLAFSALNTSAVSVDRTRVTNEALARAKDALIAYAVADTVRPGELPCPDINDDGRLTLGEDVIGSACASLIGRLPWYTLGLPDLRDDAGERLWYALSNDFHANGPVALNSDTAYRAGNVSLTLTGTSPAGNLVAIVFSPGATLTRSDGIVQTRGCTIGTNCDASLKCTAPVTSAPKCNPANYLDVEGGEDNADGNRTFAWVPRSLTFNDRVMPVFSDDIMRLVERRAARELAQHLRDHYNAWQNSTTVSGANKGFYPFAVPWNDPSSTPAQLGTNNTTSGLLPLSNAPLTWSNLSASCVTESAGTVLHCQAVCIFVLGIPVCVPDLPSGQVENVAARFVDPPTAANFQFVGINLGGSGNWTLNEAQRRLEFSYSGLVSAGTLDVRITAPAPSSWVSGWLARNNWHQNAYYAFAPGFAMNGNNLCGANCFSIANTSPVTSDKHAIVVMTGRSLSQAATAQDPRPVGVLPAALVQYLEDGNSDALTPTVFEIKARTAAFNDTPVAVEP
jgi:hypothetical protein